MTAPWLLGGALLGASLLALALGQDSNWDLLNYHLYNAYAFVNGRIDWDIAPAQLQSFYNPTLDLPFYWAVRADLRPQLITLLLAVPTGVAWFFLALVLERLFGPLQLARWRIYTTLAFVIGVTGTAGAPLVGTTTNDWPVAMLIVIALWLCLKSRSPNGVNKLWPLALAGLLAGLAGGLKLTALIYVAGLGLALLLTMRPLGYRTAACAGAFFTLAAVGFLAASGYWLWRMYGKFANPIFPYFNDWIRSPWWDASPIHSGYGPTSFVDWLMFPFRLLRRSSGVVGELSMRDWRVPLVVVVALVALVARLLKTSDADRAIRIWSMWEWRFVIAFWCVAFLLWAFEYSIYRYFIPLELLSGAIAIAALCLFVPARARIAGALVVTVLAVALTRYPVALRVPFGAHFFAIEAPRLPDDALVLLIENAPLAYVIPFLNPSARFVGAKNNFNDPARTNLLSREVKQSIEAHVGSFFSLSSSNAADEEALKAYGLVTDHRGCERIATNMRMGPLKLCRLTRLGNAQEPAALQK